MPAVVKLYNTICAGMISNLYDKHKKTVKWQLSLSQKAGGYGMRSPEHYSPATRISAYQYLRKM